MGAEGVALFVSLFIFSCSSRRSSSSDGVGRLRVFPALKLFSKLLDKKNWFDIFQSFRYMLTEILFALPIFGLTCLNKNVFESIMDLLNIIFFTCLRFSLS